MVASYVISMFSRSYFSTASMPLAFLSPWTRTCSWYTRPTSVRNHGSGHSVVRLSPHPRCLLRGIVPSDLPQSLISIESLRRRLTWRFWRGETLGEVADAIIGREGPCLDRRTDLGWDVGAPRGRLSSVNTVTRSELQCAAMKWETPCVTRFCRACMRFGTITIQRAWTL